MVGLFTFGTLIGAKKADLTGIISWAGNVTNTELTPKPLSCLMLIRTKMILQKRGELLE